MMRKWLFLSLAAWFALGVATAFAADSGVTIQATIDKTETKSITETLAITKVITLQPTVQVTSTKAAESDALSNQSQEGGTEVSTSSQRTDTIQTSGNTNSGILTLNQASGNMNNQGSAVSVAVDVNVTIDTTPGGVAGGGPSVGGFANSQASVDQETENGTITTVNLLVRSAKIDNSINLNTGVVHANQSTGSMSNQSNDLSIALSLTGGAALAEADLGQINSTNTSNETAVGVFQKTATLTGSVLTNKGVISVNQTVGNFANQANVVSIAASLTR